MPSAKKSSATTAIPGTKTKAEEKPAAKTSAKPRGDDRDRSIMDKAGATSPTFLHEQANLDRQDAATAALDKALGKCKELAAAIVKSIAHAQATETDEMKMACLDEIATLGNKCRDKARTAIRDAKKAQAKAEPAPKAKAKAKEDEAAE
tara:strand:+ start:1271 stop:1717 length:447 start_codon:yes stop_codon:yes gene_type:complete